MALNNNTYNKAKEIFTEFLEKKGQRKTHERYDILKKIYSTDGHFEVESLYISMKNNNYHISRATIYNTLDLLVECDLVAKHQFFNNIAQYEKSYGYKQHDHLICTECQKIVEFCDPRIQNIRSMIGELLNFKVIDHSLNLYGICMDEKCENKKCLK